VVLVEPSPPLSYRHGLGQKDRARPGDGRAVHDAPRCWQPQDRHVCNKSPYAFVGSGPRPCSHDILFGGQPWHNQSTSPSHDVDPHSEDGPVATIMLKYK
jgi:hypothetical protein